MKRFAFTLVVAVLAFAFGPHGTTVMARANGQVAQHTAAAPQPR
jgi:hypothetical protein